jgi:maleate cis-trans isomerase
VSQRIFLVACGVIIYGCLLSACTKGYNFSEAVYNASQTQNQLNSTATERAGKQDMNFQQYESERKNKP